MPFKYADRVKETSTSTGTGSFSLSGAVSGFQTFLSGIGANNTCQYSIVHRTAAEWEVGLGTLDMMGTTLTRTTIQASSNLGSAVTFSAGTKDIFVTIPAKVVPTGDLVAGGRLTLGTGQPYQFTTIGSATLYYTPAISSTVYLWTGTYWTPYQLTSDLSISNTSTAASKIYDISINWNSGSPTLVATQWSTFGAGSSTRTTAITYQDQIPLVSGNRYIGTVFTDASNLFADSSSTRYVWNAYNRTPRYLGVTDGTTSWTYASTAYRNANAIAANRVSFVVGITDWSMCHLLLHSGASNATAGQGGISALGLNATNFVGFTQGYNTAAIMPSQVANQQTFGKAEMTGHPVAGYNYVQWIERIITSGTTTFYGATDRAGIQGWIEC
jgi:hypothetical protein